MTKFKTTTDDPSSSKIPDRVLTIAATLAGILNLIKDISSIFGYLLLFLTVMFLLRSWIAGHWTVIKNKRAQKKSICEFADRFLQLVSEAADFMRSTNTYSIPFYIRCNLAHPELKRFKPSESVENLFVKLINRLESSLASSHPNFREFETANENLFEYLDAYTRIYVTELVSSVALSGCMQLLSISERGELNTRFDLFMSYLQKYNSYRAEFERMLGKTTRELRLIVPTARFI